MAPLSACAQRSAFRSTQTRTACGSPNTRNLAASPSASILPNLHVVWLASHVCRGSSFWTVHSCYRPVESSPARPPGLRGY